MTRLSKPFLATSNEREAVPNVVDAVRIVVLPDRIEATLRVRDASCRKVSPSLVASCKREFPELAFHACKNDWGPRFGDVMDRASVPHLLEHLVITLQVRRDQQDGRENFGYLGTTQWVSPGSCSAKVSVRFRNDVICLACLKEALAFVNEHF